MKFSIVVMLLLTLPSIAQNVHSIDVKHPIEIQFNSNNTPVAFYKVNKENSIYKASKIFHISIKDILVFNKIEDSRLVELGKVISIPINFKYVYRGSSLKSYKSTTFIPITYTVKPKENLFRIAKVYCKESVTEMKARNSLESNNLQVGQELIIGWLPVQNDQIINLNQNEGITQNSAEDEKVIDIKKTENLESSTPIAENINNTPLTETTLEDSSLPKTDSILLKQENGIAIWKKSSKGHSKYALHPTAKLNTVIQLYNPLVNRTVSAKVIGRIPTGAYSNDVSVIISPATAVSLGALDHRFKVKMTYEEDL